jgi:hypothetical protein
LVQGLPAINGYGLVPNIVGLGQAQKIIFVYYVMRSYTVDMLNFLKQL